MKQKIITSCHKPEELCGTWIDDNGVTAIITQTDKRTTFLVEFKDPWFGEYNMTLSHLETWNLCGVCKKIN